MDGEWEQVRLRLDATVESVPWGSFLLVQHGDGDGVPYAQGAPGPAGWYLEVVSAAYLPAEVWSLDEPWLARAGWLEPDGETLNWWRSRVPADGVAGKLLDGLRHGRGCLDPSLVRVSVGRFPDGPDGGEPLPVLDDEVVLAS